MFVLVFEFVFVVEFVLVFVVEFVVVEFVVVEFGAVVFMGVEVSVLGVELVNGKFGLTPLALALFVLVLVLAVPLQANPKALIPTSIERAMIFFILCVLLSSLTKIRISN